MKYQLTIKDSNEIWYFLPTMGGHILSYYKLSKLLDGNSIGLTCKGLDRNIPNCKTLEEHIDYFLNLLDPNQESYNFIGYCMGGVFISELDKYISVNKSVIINFPFKPTSLDFDTTNMNTRYINVLKTNKEIFNNWYENIYLPNGITLKKPCLLIESYKNTDVVEKITPNHYINMEVDDHLNILKEPYVNLIANHINTFTNSNMTKNE